jgi:large subunit ribosomal protein L24
MKRLTTGDEVLVVRGNDKGKRGKIRRVIAEKNAVVIEGVNVVKRHLRAQPNRPGGILEIEAPLDQSKVVLIDPNSGKPTKVKFKTDAEKKVRVGKGGSVIAEPQRS